MLLVHVCWRGKAQNDWRHDNISTWIGSQGIWAIKRTANIHLSMASAFSNIAHLHDNCKLAVQFYQCVRNNFGKKCGINILSFLNFLGSLTCSLGPTSAISLWKQYSAKWCNLVALDYVKSWIAEIMSACSKEGPSKLPCVDSTESSSKIFYWSFGQLHIFRVKEFQPQRT